MKRDMPGECAMTNTTDRPKDAALGYLLLRATIATSIFAHGLSRILAGPSRFADVVVPAFQHTLLPAGFVRLFALALPGAESIIGMLVLVGFRTRLALLAGSLLTLTLTFGATLNQDWESAGLQLIYANVHASLLAFRYRNSFSVDGVLQRNPSKAEQS
jgi:thiosulfate dehydrogenase (quinone) large subunit